MIIQRAVRILRQVNPAHKRYHERILQASSLSGQHLRIQAPPSEFAAGVASQDQPFVYPEMHKAPVGCLRLNFLTVITPDGS